jgi:hypothetical protein
MVVLVFAVDHELQGSADAAIWALVGAISHAAIAPFVSLAIAFSNRFNNWRTDLLALIGLGIARGIAINLCVDALDTKSSTQP